MNHYKLGLATAKTAMRVGAISSSWTMSNYQDAADTAWNKLDKSNGTGAVIAYAKDGAGATVKQFSTGAEASAAYDVLVNAPGQLWYITLYDQVAVGPGETARRDETYLGGVNEETVVIKKKETPLWPWVVGFLGLGGVYMASSKKKGGGL